MFINLGQTQCNQNFVTLIYNFQIFQRMACEHPFLLLK